MLFHKSNYKNTGSIKSVEEEVSFWMSCVFVVRFDDEMVLLAMWGDDDVGVEDEMWMLMELDDERVRRWCR